MNNAKTHHLGLKENWKAFWILVLVNAFVGGMVGLERTIIPQFAEELFGIASKSALLSFIIAFGITKAITNYFTGRLANYFGRKRLLIVGWCLALPVPFLLLFAGHWNVVILANVFLGVSQGLTWSTTVIMKIDLVGDKDRGFAMGLNEFAGYLAVGLTAFATGWIAHHYGVVPYPFYLGMVIAAIGLLLSVFWVKDTMPFVKVERIESKVSMLRQVFYQTTFKNKTLSSVTQAGLVNNLNDGMVWGLLPVLLLQLQQTGDQMGWITAAYPTVWGISQLFTGKMADVYSKKHLLVTGMFLQGFALLLLVYTAQFWGLMGLMVVLGLGTALVYPTFLATIAEATHPDERAESLGTFRFWRDMGYAVGAVVSGAIADAFGLEMAIVSIGVLTMLSALVIQVRMPYRHQ